LAIWHYLKPPTDPSGVFLDVIPVLNQSFFMGAFFLISRSSRRARTTGRVPSRS